MAKIAHDEYIEISRALSAQPMPKLVRKTDTVFTDGERVRYRGGIWFVFGTPTPGSMWVRLWDGAKDGCIQAAPADAVEKAPKKTPRVQTASNTGSAEKKAPRPARGPDDVVFLLREAISLEELWSIADRLIPYSAELRVKVGHLNPGLQRMNIGNHIRKLVNQGAISLKEKENDYEGNATADSKTAKPAGRTGRARSERNQDADRRAPAAASAHDQQPKIPGKRPKAGAGGDRPARVAAQKTRSVKK